MLLTGPNGDFVLNCCLFLLAVFPSHIHSFYISFTYFNRKRKVRKGIYPGQPKSLIYSDKVNNGGASRREMEMLKAEMETGKSNGRTSNRRSKRVSGFDDEHEKYYDGALSPEITRTSSRRSRSLPVEALRFIIQTDSESPTLIYGLDNTNTEHKNNKTNKPPPQ
ncbi:hypothetical protein DV736_g2578, partial [Chaetothyriales sp. CBS 134916]